MNSDTLTATSPASSSHQIGSVFQLQIRRVFLICGALLGACYTVILPPLQAPDEFAHLYRAYNVSDGYCVAPLVSPMPGSIKEFTSLFPPHLEALRRIGAADLSELMRMPLDDARREGVWNQAINVYNCVPYVPAAMGIFAGRLFSSPPVGLLYLARLANLLTFLVIVYLALRLLPDFHLALFSLALMPMTLQQAGSASWDAVSFSTAFFLCAYIVKLAWDNSISALQPKHYWILAAAIIIGSLCKANIWLAPLLLCVPASKFGSARRKWVILLAYSLLALVVVAGWNYINRDDIARWTAQLKDGQQINFAENAAVVYQHPWLFLQTFLRTWTHRPDLPAEFVGKLGWLVVTLPDWALWAYVALLGCVSLTGTAAVRMTAGHRVVFLGVVGLAVGSMLVALWCANTPQDYRVAVLHGDGVVPGVQGRYFIPFALPLLLAFSNTRLRVNRKWLLGMAAVAVLTVNAVALQRIHSTYYLTGSAAHKYETKLVKRYGASAEATKVFLVQSGERHWISHVSWITRHGYRWPDDVVTISAAELASIPEGSAITEE